MGDAEQTSALNQLIYVTKNMLMMGFEETEV